MKDFTISPPAKINLALVINGITDNGYHEVETVMVKLPIYDQLRLTLTPSAKQDELKCNDATVPTGKDNLIEKTLTMWRQWATLPACQIDLQKNISVAAGLAGGSSDAGSLLKAISTRSNQSFTSTQLQQIALSIGADVPFFTRDELVTYERHHGCSGLQTSALPSLPSCQLVLVYQNQALDTPAMYQAWDRQGRVNKKSQAKLDQVVKGLHQRNLELIAANLVNDFWPVTLSVCPGLATVQKQLLQAGALGVSLTGKGPTVYGLFAPTQKVNTKKLQGMNYQILQLESINDKT